VTIKPDRLGFDDLRSSALPWTCNYQWLIIHKLVVAKLFHFKAKHLYVILELEEEEGGGAGRGGNGEGRRWRRDGWSGGTNELTNEQ
jgi:hypothetical protein